MTQLDEHLAAVGPEAHDARLPEADDHLAPEVGVAVPVDPGTVAVTLPGEDAQVVAQPGGQVSPVGDVEVAGTPVTLPPGLRVTAIAVVDCDEADPLKDRDVAFIEFVRIGGGTAGRWDDSRENIVWQTDPVFDKYHLRKLSQTGIQDPDTLELYDSLDEAVAAAAQYLRKFREAEELRSQLRDKLA